MSGRREGEGCTKGKQERNDHKQRRDPREGAQGGPQQHHRGGEGGVSCSRQGTSSQPPSHQWPATRGKHITQYCSHQTITKTSTPPLPPSPLPKMHPRPPSPYLGHIKQRVRRRLGGRDAHGAGTAWPVAPPGRAVRSVGQRRGVDRFGGRAGWRRLGGRRRRPGAGAQREGSTRPLARRRNGTATSRYG